MSSRKKKRFSIRPYIPLLIILALSLIIRLLLINTVPIGITGDELDYIINAKAVFLTGSDISGTWNPLSLTNPPFEYPKGEALYLLLAPLVGLFPFSLTFARLPFVIASILLVGSIYLTANTLIGKRVAIIAGILAAINPWMIVFGRTGYDTAISVSFYLVALSIILLARRWWILLSIPFLFFAFFGYVGTKLIFLPFVGITLFYAYKFIHKENYLKQYLTVFVLCMLCFSYFLFSLSTEEATRAGDLKSPNSTRIAQEVDTLRQIAVQTPFTPVFTNKYTVFLHEASNQYLGAFSPQLLFISGEYTPFYTIRDQGFFYPVDFVFLILGVGVLFAKNRRVFFFLTAIALIAAIPTAASDTGTSYAIRSGLTVPLLLLFVASGIDYILSNKKQSLTLLCIIGCLYLFFFGRFFHNYLFQAPVYSSEQANFSARVIAKYILLAKDANKTVTILTRDTNPEDLISSFFFKQYLFYSNEYDRSTADEIASHVRNGEKEYNHVRIVPCSEYAYTENTIVIREHKTCEVFASESAHLTIPRLSDGGEVYAVYDDYICPEYNLKLYPSNINLSDLNIENQGVQTFCETFVTKQMN